MRVVIDGALDTVAALSNAGFWTVLAEARASAAVHEEAPFAVRQMEGGQVNVVSGAIDLVYRVGDGWLIVNYKTGTSGTTGELDERYRAQVTRG